MFLIMLQHPNLAIYYFFFPPFFFFLAKSGFFFQDNSNTEEESETLLSALTEMLDSVEDDDRTMSPFDTLPDTKLLTYPEPRDNSGVGAHSGTRATGQK